MKFNFCELKKNKNDIPKSFLPLEFYISNWYSHFFTPEKKTSKSHLRDKGCGQTFRWPVLKRIQCNKFNKKKIQQLSKVFNSLLN